ncbi:winged helix-turn-helix domain-containing protein [Nonomuraea sp. 3-1Str]|uniref:ArsR/SmtB family transcription factor n=1 Tax=Nonomuraea sp. 3-1Str TaxID=2929801 RepID=UPI002864291C|nr:winged helix-turn-helix domain-containing protein [Nonomuraea sp. 3-1Str]MDR8414363.1 winged helix-turn-helix domain-containing protein [Nonomuraea sp. 3-1Str]
MMRVHFSDADLRLITFTQALNALWETVLSVRLLRGAPTGRSWSRPGVRRLHRQVRGSLVERAGVLAPLVTPKSLVPAFLLQPDAGDFATGVELASQTPSSYLAVDLSSLSPAQRSGRWAGELAAGTAAARQTLAGDLHRYFTSSVESLWPHIQAEAAADRALRAETLMRGGVDALLATLHPDCRWQPPTLHIPIDGDHDIPLCGRGLLLIPSYFAPRPMVLYRPDAATVLVYPIVVTDRSTDQADVLGPLLGRTRAAVLATLRDPATTTSVAERVGISLGSASQHTAILRNAGLISTTRTGGAVLHTLTPLGQALLRGGPNVGS